jgi:hypothetical protein
MKRAKSASLVGGEHLPVPNSSHMAVSKLKRHTKHPTICTPVQKEWPMECEAASGKSRRGSDGGNSASLNVFQVTYRTGDQPVFALDKGGTPYGQFSDLEGLDHCLGLIVPDLPPQTNNNKRKRVTIRGKSLQWTDKSEDLCSSINAATACGYSTQVKHANLSTLASLGAHQTQLQW